MATSLLETPGRVVSWGQRLPFLASAAYVGVLVIVTDRGREPRGWLSAAAAVAIALGTAGRPAWVLRAVGWGLAVVIASVGAEASSRALDACGCLGVLSCVVGACAGIARLKGSLGMVPSEPQSSTVPVAAVTVVWWSAIVAFVAPRRYEATWLTDHPRAWSRAAAVVSAAAIGLALAATLRQRRFEIEVVERARAMRDLVVTVLVASALIAIFGHADADSLARLSLAFASLLVVAPLRADPVVVVRCARRTASLTIAGGAVALLAGTAIEGRAGDPWLIVVAAAAVAVVVGANGARLEGPWKPARGAWLDAFARASEIATGPDPHEAIRGAIEALRMPIGLGFPSPELFTFSPGRVAIVDAAGYLQEREADLPRGLVAAAVAEPDGALRADVLRALEVRRPELRSFAGWMDARAAILAVAVGFGDEPDGLLVLPQGSRAAPMSLEEIRALKQVADRIATACRARTTEVRMLERAQREAERAEQAEEQIARLAHARALEVGRAALAAARLARSASVGMYATASRMALEAIERRTAIGAPIAVVAPGGVDPVPYLARAHLKGARRGAPFVLVDGTGDRERDLEAWVDPTTSPLALADGGLLVLLDGAALPAGVQQLIARACAEARAPWDRPDRLDVQLALTAFEPPEALVAAHRLEEVLAARLGDARHAPIALPRLHDRPEDFRAILTDRLGRAGLRTLGRPVGIEPTAYARLAEYSFPGDEEELSVLVQRLVSSCRGDTIRAKDVEALRISPTPRGGVSPGRRKDPLSA
ncbi:MAG: hypothetical protein ABSC94_21345 [Polyangiaceae bacterium]|jgi:hypothetical protein